MNDYAKKYKTGHSTSRVCTTKSSSPSNINQSKQNIPILDRHFVLLHQDFQSIKHSARLKFLEKSLAKILVSSGSVAKLFYFCKLNRKNAILSKCIWCNLRSLCSMTFLSLELPLIHSKMKHCCD